MEIGLIYEDLKILKSNSKWVIQSLTTHYQQATGLGLQSLKATLSDMVLEGKKNKCNISPHRSGASFSSPNNCSKPCPVPPFVSCVLCLFPPNHLYRHWFGNFPFYLAPQTDIGPGGTTTFSIPAIITHFFSRCRETAIKHPGFGVTPACAMADRDGIQPLLPLYQFSTAAHW